MFVCLYIYIFIHLYIYFVALDDLMLTSSLWLRSCRDSSWRRSRQGVVAFCPQRQMGTGALDDKSGRVWQHIFGDITAHHLSAEAWSILTRIFWALFKFCTTSSFMCEENAGFQTWSTYPLNVAGSIFVFDPRTEFEYVWILFVFLSSLLVIANEVWATFIHATVIFSGFFAPLRYVPWLKVPTWVLSQGHPSSTNFCCVPQNFTAANQMAIVSSNVLYYTFTRL